ncbi:hypothetical protein ACM39_13240 [Chryseobacterium sp. FH2]|uniref:hypothetical protein n=1 Tax=Chryseobacterium sp. FH2 TaxID=1674291 RepID=UPI00065ACFC1|nr:hypothetical protein [Chryseobacterium sp. FH2]KMQ67402.1 hypothetical protein ACM39_13240 [Chryseobacterium sp. FH2]
MKQILTVILALTIIFSYGQEYSFAKDFKTGTIILKDGSVVEGQLKWFPSQNGDVKFKKNEQEKTVKYTPADLVSFSSDNMKFVPLNNFTVYSDNYALIGRPSTIKDTFAQVISEGKINVYLVPITGYNAISRSIENYFNFVFQDSQDPDKKLYAYPYLIRMKEKKYENAKENLYPLFKDYPQITEKIKAFKKEDNFLEIIRMIEEINKQ